MPACSRDTAARNSCGGATSSVCWLRGSGTPSALRARVKVEWDNHPPCPAFDALHDQMRSGIPLKTVVLERGNVRAAAADATVTVVQRGLAPYQAHAPFAPNCALADIRAEGGDLSSVRHRMCTRPVAASRRSLGHRARRQLRVQLRGRVRHLWPQLLRRCGAGRRAAVAAGRRTRAAAADALGRTWLGHLRARRMWAKCAPRLNAEGKLVVIRVPRLAAQLEPGGDHRAAGRRLSRQPNGLPLRCRA